MARVLLGVGHGGVHFLRPSFGKEKKLQPFTLVASHSYNNLEKWQVNESGKVLSLTMKYGPDCAVMFSNAKAIADLVTEYVSEYHQILEALATGGSGLIFEVGGKARSREIKKVGNESEVPLPPFGLPSEIE